MRRMRAPPGALFEIAAINAYIYQMGDSVDAEIVSLIYAVRDVMVQKGYRKAPQIKEWWPTPEVRPLSESYSPELDERLQGNSD